MIARVVVFATLIAICWSVPLPTHESVYQTESPSAAKEEVSVGEGTVSAAASAAAHEEPHTVAPPGKIAALETQEPFTTEEPLTTEYPSAADFESQLIDLQSVSPMPVLITDTERQAIILPEALPLSSHDLIISETFEPEETITATAVPIPRAPVTTEIDSPNSKAHVELDVTMRQSVLSETAEPAIAETFEPFETVTVTAIPIPSTSPTATASVEAGDDLDENSERISSSARQALLSESIEPSETDEAEVTPALEDLFHKLDSNHDELVESMRKWHNKQHEDMFFGDFISGKTSDVTEEGEISVPFTVRQISSAPSTEPSAEPSVEATPEAGDSEDSGWYNNFVEDWHYHEHNDDDDFDGYDLSWDMRTAHIEREVRKLQKKNDEFADNVYERAVKK